jgi:ActR/RegA family two-component response regulator
LFASLAATPSHYAESLFKQIHPGESVWYDEPIEYFRIETGAVTVREKIDPKSPVLGMVRRGEHLPVVETRKSWVKIVYKNDQEGWIERKHGVLTESAQSLFMLELTKFSLLIGITAIFVVVIVIVSKKVAGRLSKGVTIKKSALVVTSDTVQIRNVLTDTTTTLERCFSEIGFRVYHADTLDTVRNLVVHYIPDVVIVDWRFSASIYKEIENLLSERPSTTNILVIFINVPDINTVSPSMRLGHVNFLGVSFTDRDIFRLVTPLVITGEKERVIQKSVQASALEGEVEEGSLSTVFQFIEIGKKTGCLLVRRQQPYGIVYFERGCIVYADSPDSTGKSAVKDILNLKSGHFRFLADKSPSEKNMDTSVLEILMEWSKETDEAVRA